MSNELIKTPIEIDAQRVCSRCATSYLSKEFYEGRAMCRFCVCKQVKAARARNSEYYRQFDKDRANLPHRVAARKAYQQTAEGRAAFYRATLKALKRHPEKVRARGIANRALKSGRLQRHPCEICGDRNSEKHHEDYSKPLVVRWLCLLHHKQAHGYMGTVNG